MVVKTELCAFSEYRIYPGHGMKYIRRDGQPVLLSTSKCRQMMNQRKKPQKLVWTQAWRRLNKKGLNDGSQRKKVRKSSKIQRAIVGASVEDLKKKRSIVRTTSAAAEAALKEVKGRTKTAGKKSTAQGARGGASVPKGQKSSAASSRGSSGR